MYLTFYEGSKPLSSSSTHCKIIGFKCILHLSSQLSVLSAERILLVKTEINDWFNLLLSLHQSITEKSKTLGVNLGITLASKVLKILKFFILYFEGIRNMHIQYSIFNFCS